jgi:hypothetical protein
MRPGPVHRIEHPAIDLQELTCKNLRDACADENKA